MSQLVRDGIAARRAASFQYAGTMAPEDWAEQIYRLPGGGRFRWSYAPYTRQIFRSYFDKSTIETVLEMYSRGLKSTTVLLLIGYLIDQMPMPMLSLWPTDSNAELWSKDVLVGELFDTTDPLNYLGTEAKRRSGGNTLLHKSFPGGRITMFGANAPGNMRRAKGALLYADEIDAIKRNESDEGDPLAIFNKRGDEFPSVIRVFASYPSVRGMSRIDAKMTETDGNQWFSTCVRCGGEPFVMHRSMLVYEKDDLAGARMKCPRCRELLTDAERHEMAHNQGFDNWRPQREFKGKRGFHANAMLWPHPVAPEKYPGGFLQLLAQQEVDADNSEDPKGSRRVLINTVDAECYDPTEDIEKPPEWEMLFDRREDYTEAPKEAIVLNCFTDVQHNRFEVGWTARGRDEQAWGLAHTVLHGNPRDIEFWQTSLTRELQRKFKRADGATLILNLGFIDGGWASEMLYLYLKWVSLNQVPGIFGKIKASKGEGKAGHPIIDRTYRTVGKNLKGFHIGTWEAKENINESLRLQPNPDGSFPAKYMHFNKSYDEQYFRQLCTGIATIDYDVVDGKLQEVRKYLNKDKLKDEALDIEVGNLAAFRKTRPNFDAMEAQLLSTIQKEEPKPEVVSEYPPKASVPENGFLGVGSNWAL